MDAKEYVGMEWEWDVKGNTNKFHQSAFCEKLLEDFGYCQCVRSAKTPEIPRARLSMEDSPEVVDPTLHRRDRAIVGAFGWLQQGTRPDIAHVVSHWLSGTYTDSIYYGKDSQWLNKLWDCVDTDFAAELDTRWSHTGYILMLNGGSVYMEIDETEKRVVDHNWSRMVCGKWRRKGDRVFAQHPKRFWLWASLTNIALRRFKGSYNHDWKPGESKIITTHRYSQVFHRATGGRQDNSIGAMHDG